MIKSWADTYRYITMHLRLFWLIIFAVMFFHFSPSQAEDCSCPVVQCDPCQKKLILGTQIKECSRPPAVVCQKIVCENVDNYFQCIAGAPPLYVPPQDPSLRYTEPKYTPQVSVPQEIDFTRLTKAAETVGPQASPTEDSAVLAPRAISPAVSRGPASIEMKEKEARLFVVKETGQVYVEKTALKKKNTFLKSVNLWAKKPSHLKVTFFSDVVEISMEKNARLELLEQDGVLVAQKIKGDLRFEVKSSRDLFVADLGAWRFGKKKGKFQILEHDSSIRVTHQDDVAYLRKKELISKADILQPGFSYFFEEGSDLYSSLALDKAKPAIYQLSEARASLSEREPANAVSKEFCGAPQGQYEECAWKCFGATPDAKNCTGLQTTAQCVRFTCSADGQWKLPTIVSGGECKADSIHVGICH